MVKAEVKILQRQAFRIKSPELYLSLTSLNKISLLLTSLFIDSVMYIYIFRFETFSYCFLRKIFHMCCLLCVKYHSSQSSQGLLCVWGKTVLLLYIYSSRVLFFRLFETLQSLFWSIFGLINLYVTNVKARHEFTEFVGATMFGTYNVISLVVLLNMLIAMMNNSYQLIAVSRSLSLDHL